MSRKPQFRKQNLPGKGRRTEPDELYHQRNRLRGRRWRKLRAAKLVANPFCEQCERDGIVAAAHSVDHIKPSRGNPDLHFDWDNLQSLCIPCERAKTREDYQEGRLGNPAGWNSQLKEQ